MLELFRETAKKLAFLSGLKGEEYHTIEMDSEDILNEIVPKALFLFSTELPDVIFCDLNSTPLLFLARQVSDLLLVEYSCRDPTTVVGAILADLPSEKEVELKILDTFGQQYLMVWKEIKLFLDPKKCEVKDHNNCLEGECTLAWLEGKR